MTPEQKKLLAGVVNPLYADDSISCLTESWDCWRLEVLKPTIDLLKAKLALVTS